jgi:nitroreductase
MDVFDAIKKRRSVRRFLEVPLDWEPVGQILDAGRLSPTAGNVQDAQFVVVLEHNIKQKIAEACFEQYWIAKAPVIIVIGTDPLKNEQFYGARGAELYTAHDAAAAAMSMLLAAEAQGLAACWVGAFEERMLREAIGMPDSVKPHVVLPIGYADEKPQQPLKFGVESVVFMNSWGNKYSHMTDLTGEFSHEVDKALRKGKELIEKAKKQLQRV